MATVTAESILCRAQIILQDTTGTRWPAEELLGWLNDAYREIVMLRPDAHSQIDTFECAAGTRQDLQAKFPNALRLLDVVRNQGAGAGAIRHIDRRILDDQRPFWHSETASSRVQHYTFDSRAPTSFLVYPPATSGALVEVVFSSVPTGHTAAEVDLETPCS
ncbi:MAG: hypothetical protein MZV65_38930 [Chromatiales bacterium]|nr:hypothetical protein [Chromatiales bacterium]